MIIIVCQQTGSSWLEWHFFIFEKKKTSPLFRNWSCNQELNWTVTNCSLLESCLIFPTGNRTLLLNSGLLFVFLFCIIFILSLSLLIPGGAQTFFFVGKRELSAGAEHPAEGVKSKAINERRVHLFGLVRITGTLAKWKKYPTFIRAHISSAESESLENWEDKQGNALFHLFSRTRSYFFEALLGNIRK